MAEEPEYYPHEFFPVFEQFPKVGQAVICGGQAVNILAAVFLGDEEMQNILGPHGAITSGDMDIVISEELRKQIITTAGKPNGLTIRHFADCRQPIQFAILPSDMPDTRIDVLRNIKGIHIEKDRVFGDSIELQDIPYNIINPVTLLIAKAENCATLDQDSSTGKRNDADHLRLLVKIVHNYLAEMVDACDPTSKSEQREIIYFLKKLHSAASKTNFKNGMHFIGAELHETIPISHIQNSKLDTLTCYLNGTFLDR